MRQRSRCQCVWKLPELWTHSTRPQLLAKPQNGFARASTRLIILFLSEGTKETRISQNHWSPTHRFCGGGELVNRSAGWLRHPGNFHKIRDRSSTYASEDYQAVLETHGITCSMSRRGNCYDNAVMEAFFSTVKNEVGEWYESHGDAKGQLFDYIEVFYNQRRRHSSAGRMSPAAFERKMTQAA